MEAEVEEFDWENFHGEAVNSVQGNLRRLKDLWDVIGITKYELKDRAQTALHLVNDLFEQMQEEDTLVLQKIKENIETNSKKFHKLCKELSMPIPELPLGPPLMQERTILQDLEALKSIKDTRMEKLDNLRERESSLSLTLAMEPYLFAEEKPVPSEDDLLELEQHLQMLMQEKETRLRKFNILRSDVRRIIRLLEKHPSTHLECELLTEASGLEENIILAQDRMTSIKTLAEKLTQEKTDAETKLQDQRNEVALLWEGLASEELHRAEFLKAHNHCGRTALTALAEEIDRCREERLANMSKYIGKIRLDLTTWWDKCHVSKEEQQAFRPFHSEDYSEELMQLHEQEVLQWKTIYSNHSLLFKKLDDRRKLWERMLYMEARTYDPTRFTNRGGNLLQEEKERRTLIRRLPDIEEDLRQLAEKFNEDTGRTFRINGLSIPDYFQAERQKFKESKEIVKISKAALKQRMIRKEIGIKTPKRQRVDGGARTPFEIHGASSMALRSFGLSASQPPSRINTLRSPTATFTTIKRRAAKSPHPAPDSSYKKMIVHQFQHAHRGGTLQEQNRGNPSTPLTTCDTPSSDILNVSGSSLSATSFTKILNATARPAYNRSTMVKNSMQKKVLGSKFIPKFMNCGTKRRRSGVRASQVGLSKIKLPDQL